MAYALGTLKYLYVGSSRFPEDVAYWKDVIGAETVWSFEKFGARVAAFRVADGPLWLTRAIVPSISPSRSATVRSAVAMRAVYSSGV